MSVVEADFGKASRGNGVDCSFWFMGWKYHLVAHEDRYGNLLGIDLTCPEASRATQISAAVESKRLSGILDCGVPLSSSMDTRPNRSHLVSGHPKIKTAATVTDAVVQILLLKYERPEMETLPKSTRVQFLRVHDGGMA